MGRVEIALVKWLYILVCRYSGGGGGPDWKMGRSSIAVQSNLFTFSPVPIAART